MGSTGQKGQSLSVILRTCIAIGAVFWLGTKYEQVRSASHESTPYKSVEEFLKEVDQLKPSRQTFRAYERLQRQGAGSLPDLRDADGVPLLSRLIKDNRLEELRSVLALDSYPTMKADKNGWTPLHYAANHKNAWSYLTALGQAQLDWSEHKDRQGRTALHLAAVRDDMMAVRQLLATGLSLKSEAKDANGDTALHLAVSAGDGTSIGVIAALVREYEPFATDAQGRTPMLRAVDLQKWEYVRVLSDHGDDPNQPDKKGRTARAQLQAQNQDLYRQIVPIWRRNGFATDHDESGRTPMMRAVDERNWTRVHLLSEAGADPNAIDQRRRTPRQEIERRNPSLFLKLLPIWDKHCYNTAWAERKKAEGT